MEDSMPAAENDKLSQLQRSSVFDRLANPQSTTSRRKQVIASKREIGISRKGSFSPSRGQDGRRAVSREISRSLERVTIPGEGCKIKRNWREPGNAAKHQSKHAACRRAVGSPSQYAGIQQGKFYAIQTKRAEIADETATRRLDHLLQGQDTT